MSAIVEIRNIKIGEGIPKICVPIVETSQEGIRKAAEELKKHPFDMVEWRADFFDGLSDPEKVGEVLCLLRDILEDVPILFTVRTKSEGGEIRMDTEEYLHTNIKAIETGQIDLLDVEILRGDDISFLLVEAAHQAGVKVIASNHDFEKTPRKEELITRLCKMQEIEADIVKIAVMPKTERDVLNLLDATLAMKEIHGSTPVVTMAMGKLGIVSRVSGQIFGSAITFGSAGAISAPGQIQAESLRGILEIFT